MLYVTTSWDDGHKLDVKLAELLSRFGIKGTFYISRDYPPGVHVSVSDIQHIGAKHEIGAHTLTHPDLRELREVEIREEVEGSKRWLEQIMGKEVTMFCYPSGLENPLVEQIVKGSGFRGARTTLMGSLARPTNPYQMATTLQIYPLPLRKLAGGGYYWRKLLQPLFERYSLLRRLGVPLSSMKSWQSAARAAFDHACMQGGVFHLWGHSWELEQYGMWEELEKFLAYIATKKDVRFVTNGELVKHDPVRG